MVRTQIQLTEQQSRALKRLAEQKGISVAEIVRRGVDIVLAQGQFRDLDEIRRRALEPVGKYRSGKHDVARRHDDYLAEAYTDAFVFDKHFADQEFACQP